MATLKEKLCAPDKRPQVIREAVRLVDAEVSAKSGISGLAIKAGYKAVQTIKPTLVEEAVDHLLEKFVEKLEPFYADWESKGRSPGFDSFLAQRAHTVANALLAVTDDRARTVTNQPVKKAYEKLRPQAEKNVEAAVPGLARALSRYV